MVVVRGVNASMHLIRILSQQVHRGIYPPDNLKMGLNFTAILNFSGGLPPLFSARLSKRSLRKNHRKINEVSPLCRLCDRTLAHARYNKCDFNDFDRSTFEKVLRRIPVLFLLHWSYDHFARIIYYTQKPLIQSCQ